MSIVLGLGNVISIVLWLILLCFFCYFCGCGEWKDKVLDNIVITIIVWGDVINEVCLNNNTFVSGIIGGIAVSYLCYIIYRNVRGNKWTIKKQ